MAHTPLPSRLRPGRYLLLYPEHLSAPTGAGPSGGAVGSARSGPGDAGGAAFQGGRGGRAAGSPACGLGAARRGREFLASLGVHQAGRDAGQRRVAARPNIEHGLARQTPGGYVMATPVLGAPDPQRKRPPALCEYIHDNPVKHGPVARVRAWPHSTFHAYVRSGAYPADWGDAGFTDAAGEYGE